MAKPTEEQRKYLEAKWIVNDYERKHPRIKLTRDAVNKAFGKDAWDVLNREIVEI